jgi:hypothetical protein
MTKFSLPLRGWIGCTLIPLALLQCRSEKENAEGIRPPFGEVNVSPHRFFTEAGREQQFRLDNGTSVIIPAHAFVDKDNKPVTGRVELQYREFHTPADIILSGIPMTYDSGGVRMNFQSAGMFEIHAFSEKQGRLKLGEGKEITVNMASFRGGDFSFYRFDSLTGNWEYLSPATAKANSVRQEAVQQVRKLEAQKPLLPRLASDNSTRFDIDISYDQFPELSPFSDVVWEFAGSDPSQSPEANEWIYSEKWTNVSLRTKQDQEAAFVIRLENARRNFETVITPAFSAGDYEKASATYSQRIREYNEKYASLQRQVRRQEAEASLIRSFRVSSLGLYNCDRAMSPGAVAINASFRIKGGEELPAGTSVFLVRGEQDVIRFTLNGSACNLSIDPENVNQLLVVLGDKRIGVVSREDFRAIDFENLSAQQKREYTFYLKPVERPIEEEEDLRVLLKTI